MAFKITPEARETLKKYIANFSDNDNFRNKTIKDMQDVFLKQVSNPVDVIIKTDKKSNKILLDISGYRTLKQDLFGNIHLTKAASIADSLKDLDKTLATMQKKIVFK